AEHPHAAAVEGGDLGVGGAQADADDDVGLFFSHDFPLSDSRDARLATATSATRKVSPFQVNPDRWTSTTVPSAASASTASTAFMRVGSNGAPALLTSR